MGLWTKRYYNSYHHYPHRYLDILNIASKRLALQLNKAARPIENGAYIFHYFSYHFNNRTASLELQQ